MFALILSLVSSSNFQALNSSKRAYLLLFEVFEALQYIYHTVLNTAMHAIIIVSVELIFCRLIVTINRTFISISSRTINSVPKQTMLTVSSVLLAHHVSLYTTSHIICKIFTIKFFRKSKSYKSLFKVIAF